MTREYLNLFTLRIETPRKRRPLSRVFSVWEGGQSMHINVSAAMEKLGLDFIVLKIAAHHFGTERLASVRYERLPNPRAQDIRDAKENTSEVFG